MSYGQTAAEALAHNIADVLENGPRLAWGRKTAPIAIDRQNRRVLKTGFGAMGVGTMWVEYDDEPAEWADLPEQDSGGLLGGPTIAPLHGHWVDDHEHCPPESLCAVNAHVWRLDPPAEGQRLQWRCAKCGEPKRERSPYSRLGEDPNPPCKEADR